MTKKGGSYDKKGRGYDKKGRDWKYNKTKKPACLICEKMFILPPKWHTGKSKFWVVG